MQLRAHFLNTVDTHVADEGLNQLYSEGSHIVLPVLWRAKSWGTENPWPN